LIIVLNLSFAQIDFKAGLKPATTVKRDVEKSQLEEVALKEVPQEEKKQDDGPKPSQEELEAPEAPPDFAAAESQEKAKKKKKKVIKKKKADEDEKTVAEPDEKRAEERTLTSPTATEDSQPLKDEPSVEPIKAIEAISERIRRGATVNQVNDAFRAHEFPALENIESQMALLKAVEQSGQSAVVNQVLAEESTSETPDLSNVGLRAFLNVLAVNESYNTDEIITNFHPKELSPELAKERYAQLVNQSKEVRTAQPSHVSTETAERPPVPAGAAVTLQPEVALATAEPTPRTVAQAAPSTEVLPKIVSPEPLGDATQEQQQAQEQAPLIREGDIFFALATFVSETGEAMNLVEGERVHVLEWNNDDWWYVRKHLTEEAGWVPAQYLKDEQTYALYVQKKLVEKIEKLPVFDGKYICSPCRSTK
jgi:hypothetical protein